MTFGRSGNQLNQDPEPAYDEWEMRIRKSSCEREISDSFGNKKQRDRLIKAVQCGTLFLGFICQFPPIHILLTSSNISLRF